MSDENASPEVEGNVSDNQSVESVDPFNKAMEQMLNQNSEASDEQSEGPSTEGFFREESEESESKEESRGESEERAESGESGESESGSEDGDQKEETDSSAENKEQEVKVLTGKNGEDSLEVPANTTFTHKVDGEEVEVPLQELLNNYSGKVAYDRKFQELDGRIKEFENDKNNIDSNINQFFKLAAGGNEVGALDFLLESAGKSYGLDRETFLNGFAEQIEPQLLEWVNMSEADRQLKQLQNENDYYKRQRESEAKRLSDEQTQVELEQQISKIQEVHGLDKAQFVKYYDQIVSNPKTIEGLNQNEVLQLVDRYIDNTNNYNQAKDILSGIDAELVKNEDAVWDFVDTVNLVNQQSGTKFSKEELISVAKEVYGIDKIANDISDRVNKNKTSTKSSKEPKSNLRNNYSNDDFDRLAEELKNYNI